MALRCNTSNAHAHIPVSWSGESCTIAFWMYRLAGATTTRFLAGLLDMDDATPEATGDPRFSISTSSGATILGRVDGGGGFFADTSTETYSTAGWAQVTVTFTASAFVVTEVEVSVNGVPTGTPGSGVRDLSVGGAFDRLQLGSDTTSHSNADFAHVAFWDGVKLSGAQITQLQTKLPTSVTGATPEIYEAFVGGAGAFTLSAATINATNDASLPALEAGDSAAPVITSTGTGADNGPFAANLAENSTAAFITLTADENVTWSALGGADAARFQKGAVTATTLQIQPLAAFDFENLPHANPFVVTVTATDGSGNARTVTVNATVTNVNEPPGAPTIGTATAGNASATVAFTPPAANGGPTPTSYTATSSPGGITGTGASSPIAVSGLTNGVEYTFSVTATNSEGTGPASAASNAVTPAAVTYSITSPAGGFAPNTGSGARAAGVAFNWWAFAAKQIGESLSGATIQTGSGTLNGSGQAVLSGLTLSGSWECQVRFADGGTARWTGTAA